MRDLRGAGSTSLGGMDRSTRRAKEGSFHRRTPSPPVTERPLICDTRGRGRVDGRVTSTWPEPRRHHGPAGTPVASTYLWLMPCSDDWQSPKMCCARTTRRSAATAQSAQPEDTTASTTCTATNPIEWSPANTMSTMRTAQTPTVHTAKAPSVQAAHQATGEDRRDASDPSDRQHECRHDEARRQQQRTDSVRRLQRRVDQGVADAAHPDEQGEATNTPIAIHDRRTSPGTPGRLRVTTMASRYLRPLPGPERGRCTAQTDHRAASAARLRFSCRRAGRTPTRRRPAS